MGDRRVGWFGLFTMLTSAAVAQQAPPPAAFVQKVTLNIPSQPIATAIRELCQQTGLTIVIESALGRDAIAPSLVGSYTPAEALQRILPKDLHTEYLDQKTAAVMAAPPTTANTPSPRRTASSASATADVSEATPDATAGSGQPDSSVELTGAGPGDDTHKKRSIEEVVVTGSHIRGATPASPVITVTHEDIEHSGYETVGDVIRSLPQSFGGGQNTGSIGARGAYDSPSVSEGSTANLRGLGSESTLTLINGHRLAYDGFQGSVDISLIPISAVERIEVVTDGASAQYGSDAVGGVVNFILRQRYDGAETNASYGRGTESDAPGRQQYGQLFGKEWDSGAALISYEFAKQGALYGNERSFTNVAAPTSLLPATKRNSLFVSADQDITSTISAFFQGLYTDRDAQEVVSYPRVITAPSTVKVGQFGAVLGLNVILPKDWRVSIAGNASQSRDDDATYEFSGGKQIYSSIYSYRNKLTSVDIDANGSLFAVPSGDVQLAVGSGYRKEDFSNRYLAPVQTPTEADRNVKYAYGELQVPLVEASRDRAGLEKLDLSVSGRLENYSDFGSRTSPKLGIVYVPVQDLTVHSTWGRSFRAPALQQKYGARTTYLFDVTDPASPAGRSQILFSSGANPGLQPETASSWSAGFDFKPARIPRLRLAIDYYDINYVNRISDPVPNIGVALSNPAFSPFVTRNPTPEFQQNVIAGSVFSDYSASPYNPATLAAYVNASNQNISREHADGFDTTAAYSVPISIGTLGATFNSAVLHLTEKLIASSPSQALSGAIFNPPKLRMRGGLNLESGSWNSAVFVNYSDFEVDNSKMPATHIASWTTIDAQVAYGTKDGGTLGGLTLALSVQNLFDRDPPFVMATSTGIAGLHYDATTASALGRFVSLRMNKRW